MGLNYDLNSRNTVMVAIIESGFSEMDRARKAQAAAAVKHGDLLSYQ